MNLIPILQKNKGIKTLYSTVHGTVTLVDVYTDKDMTYPIKTQTSEGCDEGFTCDGRYFERGGECVLFPDATKTWTKYISAEAREPVFYLENGRWVLGRAQKGIIIGQIKVEGPDGNIYYPDRIIKAEAFDINNFENM